MQALSYAIRSKKDWWTKYKKEIIRQRWRNEALHHDFEGGKLTVEEVDYVLDELSGYDGMRDDASGIQVRRSNEVVITELEELLQQSCFTRVYESDTLISEDLRLQLVYAVKPLEAIPDVQKDWHPRSDGLVLDLVHPSLHCLVYGKTRACKDPKHPEDDKPGSIILEPDVDVVKLYPPWSVSHQFAWIPTDFTIFSGGFSFAHSYINNIDPMVHDELYCVIEQLVGRFSFLFERVLTDCMPCHDRIHKRINGSYVYDDGDYIEPQWEDIAPPTSWRALRRQWEENRPVKLPSVPTSGYKGDISARQLRYSVQGRRVQMIIKLANIHLTPEKPAYPGGAWHVEGMANEAIVASTIFYYDSENITESSLAFRRFVAPWDLQYHQDDEIRTMKTWGLDRSTESHQILGSVKTPQYRCIAFPNLYQHRVSPFQLVNHSKPGHRKIMAVFLVDPALKVPSTSTIPPQQAHWDYDGSRNGGRLRMGPNVAMRMTEEEARGYRESLMDERTDVVDTHNSNVFASHFNMCEH